MEPRHAAPFAQVVSQWRNSTSAAAAVLASTDGRWAVVSTAVTALIAGSIAWLGAGIVPMNGTQPSAHQRALMPYELFLRLARSSTANVHYASFGPAGTSPVSVSPAAAPTTSMSLRPARLFARGRAFGRDGRQWRRDQDHHAGSGRHACRRSDRCRCLRRRRECRGRGAFEIL